MSSSEIKSQLLAKCKLSVEGRLEKIKKTIADIEESLLEESKNTSGDKHETGRAMLQIDRENAGKQLLEIEKLIQLLNRIDVDVSTDYVRLGSMVITDTFKYFISISIGAVNLENGNFLCVALNSPIGSKLSGKKVGETFDFNGQTICVMEVL